MTDLRKAAKMAYEVPLHELLESVPEDARLIIDSEDGMSTRFIPIGNLCKRAAEALRQALAQSKQEQYVTKVVAMHENGTYTTERMPIPKREWQGLTYAEMTALYGDRPIWIDFARSIEAKLKEKNT